MNLSRRAFLASLSAASLVGAMPSQGAASDVPSLRRLQSLLGIDPRYAGKNLTLDCGLVVPLTGSGAIYGDKLLDLPRLAVKHIKQLGGPTIELKVKDNKSGDPDASVQATRELGAEHVGMELTSYAAGLGAQIPGIKRFKIFSIDGSGGTALFATNKPYFWGSIAKTPTDAIPDVARYLQKAMPNVKKVAFCSWDLRPLSNIGNEEVVKAFGEVGIEIVGDERTPMSDTNFGSNLAKIKEAEPDAVCIPMYAEDPGYFMKQYALAGIGKPVFAFTDSIAARSIAGEAYENVYLALDYFDADDARNPWAKFYVSEFERAEPGYKPDFYSANTYEDFFTLWDCIRRVIEKGGDPHDGAQLDAALRANPTFKTLYGGTPTTVELGEFSLKDHSVSKRPMRILQYRNGSMKTLARFDIGGKNFHLA